MNFVRERAVPSDAIVANSSGPTLGAHVDTAHWEFATNEEIGVYLSSVRQRLETDATSPPFKTAGKRQLPAGRDGH